MSIRLTRLADSLALLSARLRMEMATDDGALRLKFGGAFAELALLQDVVSQRIASGDARLEQLYKVDAALRELGLLFAALPHPPANAPDMARPARRRRDLRAARLDAATRKLLRRAAIVLGIGGLGAGLGIPLAIAGSCTGTTSVVCSGAFTTGLGLGSPVLTALIQNLTADIMPAGGGDGIALTGAGSEGSHNGAASDGTAGGAGPNLTLNSTDISHQIITTGASAFGITAQSSGGGAGNGGGGISCPICISAGDGGAGGVGGNVGISNLTAIATGGDQSAGIYALSHGGQGGSGGDANGAPSAGTGGPGGDAGTVSITNTGKIITTGLQAHGIYGASIGGNGGSGGGGILWSSGGDGGIANVGGDVVITNNAGGDIVTSGVNAIGIYGESIGGFGGSGGGSAGLFGYGGGGSLGGDAGTVTITNNASVTTKGADAYAIFAQSVGGGGGNGGSGAGIVGLGASGSVGGKGSDVGVTNSGVLDTTGDGARGIFAQSVGGGGGNGGTGAGISGVGGSGSGTSPGGNVTISNSGAITTRGVSAYALEGESVGGGGGDGGLSIGLVSIGGSGGSGGNGGTVGIDNTGTLSTLGADSSAIFAQSVGGGGGNGGNAAAAGAFISLALGGTGGPGGNADTVGVTSKTGSITTSGDRADGIVAQSVGGGGGNGGFGISASAGLDFSVAVGIGGQGAGAGDGAAVAVNNDSAITTSGSNATGIFAQSVGGGGGNGGLSIAAAASDGVGGSFAVGGHAGGGGNGQIITLVNTGAIVTGGSQSDGILAQSVGGGGGNGGLAISGAVGIVGSLGFGIGGDGGSGGFGSAVNLTNKGDISTGGDFSSGVTAQSIGGGGGNGGGSVAGSFAQTANFSVGVGGKGDTGGMAGSVILSNLGTIATTGDNAQGLVAQSIGGGGGNGGFAVTATLSQGYAAGISVGGKGLGGGSASSVTLTGSGKVTTNGFKSTGILAQSIGGGGGNGGFAIAGTIAQNSSATFAIGGNSGNGGAGGKVSVNTAADVTTKGDLAYGILAQSIGGGGGTGGFAVAAQANESGSTIGGVSLALGGLGGPGSNADTVDLTSGGDIITSGEGAHGVVGQSIGGGGGDGGFAGSFLATLGDGATANFGVGGNGGTGGSASTATVNTSGTVTTSGQGAYGVLAQSIGGGGGDGGWGMAITATAATESQGTLVGSIGGNGGIGGLGGNVFLNNTATVTTLGSNAYGLIAQSIGGGGGDGGFSASGAFTTGTNPKTLSIGVGGQGGSGNNAGNVTLVNSGQISTTGNTVNLTGNTTDNSIDKQNAIGILAQSIGGGGGDGGATFSGSIGGPDAKTLALNVGGFGGAGGTGGEVSVTNKLGGDIETEGSFSYGIEAQSVGGGGGNGGMALAAIFGVGGEGTNANVGVTLGGQGGDGNTAALVTVNNAAGITTRGAQSAAILAQSIGGGGGAGGAAITAIMGVSSVDPDQANSRTVNVAVAVGGLGGNGSNGGVVSVSNSGALTTWADQSQGIKAQSIGGGGGDGGNSNTISLIVGAKCSLPGVCSGSDNAARNLNLQASVGGNGGGASDGNTVTVNNSGVIVTAGEMSDGIFAQSIGGGGGNGGNGSLGTGGLLPFPVTTLFLPVGAVKIYKDISVAVGGNAGSQGNGGAVTVFNTAAITTTGGNAMAINAQSVGGGGGTGGIAAIGVTGKIGIGGAGGAGGNGGAVSVTNQAVLTTSGVASYGIFAQSVGGGGGRAGNVNRGFASLLGGQYGFGIGLAFGQAGGDGGDGSAVTVDNSGAVNTSGMGSTGIFAQSVGGGGGQLGNIGNGDVNGLLGGFVGSVGDKGNAGGVSVTQSGNVNTQGLGAAGIFAQSAGGQGTGDTIAVNLTGSIATLGSDSSGIIAQSVGLNGAGNLSVTDKGNITTSGDRSTGMTLQSFGAASAQGTVVTAINTQPYALPFLTGLAKAGSISVNQTGTTVTSGANAHGILAQSVSSLGSGGAISITYNGSITASGMDADGIVAQSTGVAAGPNLATPQPFPNLSPTVVADNGNIAITINGTGTVSGGLGTGAAVRFIDGNNNTLLNYGTLTTAKGLTGVTVVGGSGNETFDNYGTLIGEVQLGGGVNAFHNHAGATIAMGPNFDTGSPGGVIDNPGTISPGGTGTVETTNLNGSISQPTGGVYLVDVDLATRTGDRINATGTAGLGGGLTLNLDNIQLVKPGSTQLTVLSAAGGATDNGLHLTNPNTAVTTYTLRFVNPTDVAVSVNVNFAPTGAGMTANDAAIGNYFNAIQTAGSSTALAPTIQTVFALPDSTSLHNFYQTISPASYLSGQYVLSQIGSNLTDSMLSCHPQWGMGWRFSEETDCSWMRIAPRSTRIDATASSMGSNSRGTDITAGHQFMLDDTFRLGLAGSFSQNDGVVENYAASHGQSYAGGVVVKALMDPVYFALGVSGGESVTRNNRFVSNGVTAQSRQNDKFLNERARAAVQLFGDEGYYARPYAEFNATQLFLGGFQETGAGALDLIAPSSRHQSGTAGVGIELGGEIPFSEVAVFRPFAGYEFKRTVFGNTLDITAQLEGAPTGVAPFTISNSPDINLHQVTGGVDLIADAGWNIRALYTGTVGDKTRQDIYSIKIAMPF